MAEVINEMSWATHAYARYTSVVNTEGCMRPATLSVLEGVSMPSYNYYEVLLD
jgi:hypothetical protein